MHVIICLFYGITLWCTLLLYAVATGAGLKDIVLAAPYVISGGIAALLALDALLAKVRSYWA